MWACESSSNFAAQITENRKTGPSVGTGQTGGSLLFLHLESQDTVNERHYRKLVHGLMGFSMLLSVVAVATWPGRTRIAMGPASAIAMPMPPADSPAASLRSPRAGASPSATETRKTESPAQARAEVGSARTVQPPRTAEPVSGANRVDAASGSQSRTPAPSRLAATTRPANATRSTSASSSAPATRTVAPAAQASRPAATRSASGQPARQASSSRSTAAPAVTESAEPVMLEAWRQGAVIGMKTTRRYVVPDEDDPRYDIFRNSRNAVFFATEADAEKARYRKMPPWKEGS